MHTELQIFQPSTDAPVVCGLAAIGVQLWSTWGPVCREPDCAVVSGRKKLQLTGETFGAENEEAVQELFGRCTAGTCLAAAPRDQLWSAQKNSPWFTGGANQPSAFLLNGYSTTSAGCATGFEIFAASNAMTSKVPVGLPSRDR